MKAYITPPRGLAICGALVFTAGALAIVLQDILDLRNIPGMLEAWTLQHTLAVLAVAGVTLTAELAWDARRAGRGIVASGFTLVTLVGLGLIVFNSVGRQAEAHDKAASAAKTHNRAVAEARRELGKAEAALAGAVAAAIAKSAEKTCAKNCKDLLSKAQDDAKADVQEARTALKGAGLEVPVPTVSAKSKQWGETLALVGVPPALTEQLSSRLEYVFWTLLFEIGAMVSWCFVRQRPVEETEATVGLLGALQALLLRTVSWLAGIERTPTPTKATVATVDPTLADLRDRFFSPDNDPEPQPTPPGNRRRRKPVATKATVASQPTATIHQLHGGNRAQKVAEAEALAWLRKHIERNGCLDEQDAMATDIEVNKGSVAKWMRKWESEGLIQREQVGRRKIVRMAPAQAAG